MHNRAMGSPAHMMDPKRGKVHTTLRGVAGRGPKSGRKGRAGGGRLKKR